MVTNCAGEPILQEPIHAPARFPWQEVTTVQQYHLSVNALKQPMEVRNERAEYRVDREEQ